MLVLYLKDWRNGRVAYKVIKMRRQSKHHYPFPQDIGRFQLLLNSICDIPEFPPIPKYVKNEARRILFGIYHRYHIKGTRREAYVIAALGVARGSRTVDDLQDLIQRVEYILGKKIPQGQIKNTLNKIHHFLKLPRSVKQEFYPWRMKLSLTKQEIKILSARKRRSKTLLKK